MAGPAQVDIALPELSDAQQKQLKALESELRCLVCQNQTLADSNAELAGDLRRVVHLQVAGGKSDDEIKAYLVQRYGDFVLYEPPLKPTTIALWAGPFALLGIGAASWFIIGRRQKLAGDGSRNQQSGQRGKAATGSDKKRRQASELLEKD